MRAQTSGIGSGHSRRASRGFTLVELMVGVVIGLLTTLVIAQVLNMSESYQRSATSGSDAQVTGALGLYAIERELQTAGYGLASTPDVLGCNLKAKYNGTAVTDLPATLTPVVITSGGSVTGGPDKIQVFGFKTQVDAAGNRGATFAVPTSVLPPNYDPSDQSAGGRAFQFPVTSVVGFAANDLVVAATSGGSNDCELFQVSSVTKGFLNRNDDAKWNQNGWPDQVYGAGSMAVNLGGVNDVIFQVVDGKLQSARFNSSTPGLDAAQDLQANVVNLKALYGKDTLTAAGVNTRTVDTYTDQQPTVAEWRDRRVIAVRVAILVRSSQYIRDLANKAEGDLTSDDDPNFYWHIGTVGAPAGAVDCPTGGGKCIKLEHDFSTDWQHYRYKLFEVVVPLRNAVWYS